MRNTVPTPFSSPSQSRARIPRTIAVVAMAGLLYGCSGGLSCGGGGGCINAYDYPQSNLDNGVQAVDDGARMRMTQSALDFLQLHLKDILLTSIGSSSSNPDYIALDIGPAQLYGQGGQLLDVNLGQGDVETYPTTVLIDATDFVDNLDMRFVQQGEQVVIGGQTITVAQDGILLDAADIPVGLDARLFTAVSFSGITATAGCDVDGSNPDFCPPGNPTCGLLTSITLGILIYPDVTTGAACDVANVECLRVNVDVVRAALGSFGTNAIDVSVPPYDDDDCNSSGAPANCSPECSDQNFAEQVIGLGPAWECSTICAVEEFGIDLVFGIVGLIAPLLENFLDDILESAITNALADVDGTPLALADRFPLAGAIPIASPATLDLGFSISPTGEAFDVNCPAGNCNEAKGMDIIMKSGFEAAPSVDGSAPVPSDCVNAIQGAAFAALYGAFEFEVPVTDPLTGVFNGEPYHVGASLAEPAINQALFAAYNAGVLCLELSTDQVHVLAGGAFPLSAGTLDVLTGGKLRQFAEPSAPAIISIVPHGPPVVTYGSGEEGDALIQMRWDDAEIGFYVLVYERFTRVFSVTTDISLGLNVWNDPETLKLNISVVDGPNVDGFVETYNELIPEVAFDGVLEDLIGLVFDAALGDGLDFDYDVATALSGALGLPLYVNLQGIETRPAGDPSFLNFYLSLTETPPPQNRETDFRPAVVLADDHRMYRPREDDTGAPMDSFEPTGEIRLTASNVGFPVGYEVFAQVDFGFIRGPLLVDNDGAVTIRDPKLRFAGEHSIRLRTRPANDFQAMDPKWREMTVVVDPYRPKVRLTVVGESIVADASDVGTNREDLVYTWTIDDEIVDVGTDTSRFDLASLHDVRKVSVTATDRAGNVSNPSTVDLKWLAARPSEAQKEWVTMRTDREESIAGGCQSVNATSLGAPLALLALFSLRRRNRSRTRP